jgi:peptidyl-prolyl cis-trans isomerase B (cyclophilin B)
MRRVLILLLAALTLVLAACGDDDKKDTGGDTTAAETTPAETNSAANEPNQDDTSCEAAEEPAPREVSDRKAPTFRPKKGKTYTWVLETSCGNVEIRMDTKRAPKTTGSIISLTRDGFYDGLLFHRIVPQFVAQGGDPQGQGTGGPGYSITETPPSDLTYEPGVVAMAKTQEEAPGTSGSQFFIVTGPAAAQSLTTPDYALVGKVSKGMDTVAKLDQVEADPAAGDRPVEPVVIKKATIRES